MDIERKLDDVLYEVWPFLIFPEQSLKEIISNKTRSLFKAALEKNEYMLDEISGQLRNIIDNRPHFDSDTESNIVLFRIRTTSFQKQIETMNKKMFEIIRRLIQCEKKLGLTQKESPPIQSDKPRKESKTRNKFPKCPNCGVQLIKSNPHHVAHWNRGLTCPRWRRPAGGCGKRYILHEDGTLEPSKIKEKKD